MPTLQMPSDGGLLPPQNRFRSLHFEFTNQCNLRCRHCYNIDYIKSGGEDLSTEEVKEVIDRALAAGCNSIGFSGGEPFMRPDILELLEYCGHRRPIHVLTNGILLDEEMIEKIDRLDLVIEFRISVDGLASHRKLRGRPVAIVLENIRNLLRHDHVVSVSTMVTQFNIPELNTMYDVMRDIKVDRWRLDFIYLAGNAARFNIGYDKAGPLLEELERLVDRYIDERPAFAFDINRVFRSAFLDSYEPFKYSPDTRPCSYQGSLTVRPDGGVSFCPSLGVVFGNILKQSIEEIAASEEWRRFDDIRVRDLSDKCASCRLVEYCGGGCRADGFYETGDLYDISDLTCVLIDFYVTRMIPKIQAVRSARSIGA